MATDQLSSVFAALADPTRRNILARLGTDEATVGERHAVRREPAGDLAAPEGARGRRPDQPRTTAQWRTNRLRTEPLIEATTWMADLTTVWSERLDRLDAHLESIKKGQQP